MTTQIFPPGPKGHLLIGNLWELNQQRMGFLVNLGNTYGDIAHFRLGPRRHGYMLNNPEYIHSVLVKNASKFNKGPALKRTGGNLVGNGLLSSEGDFHKRQRKLMQPAFHTKRVTSYSEVMVDYTLRMLDTWQAGEQRDMHEEMMKLTLEIVAKTLFDADVSGDAEAIGEAVTIGIDAVNERAGRPFALPRWVPTPKNQQRNAAAALLDETISSIIDERRASGEDKGDLLSMLLLAVDEESGGQMSKEQARAEAMTLFIAGHETTANALAWTWYLLAKHPEVEAKLVAELARVLGGRRPTFEDLAQLPYTEMVLKEAMRLYPPAWLLSRMAMEDVSIGGYDLPKESLIFISPYAMHHDARYFADPERFDPERFAPDRAKEIPSYAYFPFGGGPRVCIGQSFAMMEARLILATIAQRYQFSLEPGYQAELDPTLTLRPRNGIPMHLATRKLPTCPVHAHAAPQPHSSHPTGTGGCPMHQIA